MKGGRNRTEKENKRDEWRNQRNVRKAKRKSATRETEKLQPR